jgi:transcriptional regulator with XRE-family HTH domain
MFCFRTFFFTSLFPCVIISLKKGGIRVNDRVKELRAVLGLSMEKFGGYLGLSKSGISEIESGRRNVTDQHVKLIVSSAFDGKKVNETWLRTGEGDMFKKISMEEEIAALIAEVANEPDGSFKRRILSVLARLSEDQWDLLADIAEKLVEDNEESAE